MAHVPTVRALSMVAVLLSCLVTFTNAQHAAPSEQVAVPFVGCPSDGQIGPVKAPRGRAKLVNITAVSASRLAWYEAEGGIGVLGPRGWHCFSTYGSNGSSLFVAPDVLTSKTFFPRSNGSSAHGSTKFRGPVIQISQMFGDTSGRFSVAFTVARLFPAHRDYAERVRNEHLLIDALPTGPSATDRLNYLSKEAVEFTTPANQDGEGTDSLLVKSDLPISGVVMLTDTELDCTSLYIRLPFPLAGLAPSITAHLEYEHVSK